MWFWRLLAFALFTIAMLGVSSWAHYVANGPRWGALALTILAMCWIAYWFDRRDRRLY